MRVGINEIPLDVYLYFGHGWLFLQILYFSLWAQDSNVNYRNDVPFCNVYTFDNDMTNTCFNWNLYNDQNFIFL